MAFVAGVLTGVLATSLVVSYVMVRISREIG